MQISSRGYIKKYVDPRSETWICAIVTGNKSNPVNDQSHYPQFENDICNAYVVVGLICCLLNSKNTSIHRGRKIMKSGRCL